MLGLVVFVLRGLNVDLKRTAANSSSVQLAMYIPRIEDKPK